MEHVFVCPVVRLKFCNGQNRDARVPALTSESDDELFPEARRRVNITRKGKYSIAPGLRQRFLKIFINIFLPL